MNTDLNELRELREYVLRHGMGGLKEHPIWQIVELIDKAMADQSRQVGDDVADLQKDRNRIEWHIKRVLPEETVKSIMALIDNSYRQPTADEVAEIDRAVAELEATKETWANNNNNNNKTPRIREFIASKVNSFNLAITALRKMKGEQ